MIAPYKKFGQTVLIPVITYTDGKKDDPPQDVWDGEIWVENGEDWYALEHFRGKTVRVIERELWLEHREHQK